MGGGIAYASLYFLLPVGIKSEENLTHTGQGKRKEKPCCSQSCQSSLEINAHLHTPCVWDFPLGGNTVNSPNARG